MYISEGKMRKGRLNDDPRTLKPELKPKARPNPNKVRRSE